MRKGQESKKHGKMVSSNEELEVPKNIFEKSPILIGKNVVFVNFPTEAPVFHIKEYFKNMGWAFGCIFRRKCISSTHERVL